MPNQKCFNCLLEITKRAINLSTNDNKSREKLTERFLKATKKRFSQIKLPDYSTEIFAELAHITGVIDPFLEIKIESNSIFKDLIPIIKKSIEGLMLEEQLRILFLYSIGANMVDFSTGGHIID